jgi:hypothetical protein
MKTAKDYAKDVAGIICILGALAIFVGIVAHDWQVGFLFAIAYPALAIGTFAGLYLSFIVVCLIYGALFDLFSRYK